MKILGSVTIKKKLVISYLILVLMSLVLALTSIYTMSQSKEVAGFVHTTLDERYGRTRTTADIAYNVNHIFDRINNGENATNLLPELDKQLTLLKEAADRLQTARYPVEIGAIKNHTASFLNSYINDYIPLLKEGDFDSFVATYRGVMLNDLLIIQENVLKVNGYQIEASKNSVSSLISDKPLIIIGIVAFLELALALYIVISMPKFIVDSINKIINIAKVLSLGKLNEKILTHRQDEFKPLLESLEKMRLAWCTSVNRIQEVTLAVEGAMNNIYESADKMCNTAQDNQSHSITVAAASEEMVSTTADIAHNCENASATANETNNTTDSGISRVQDTIEKLNTQAQRSREDAKLVQKLADQAQRIGAIVNTIDDIASQTNLLALNAAIEAARAGEAGKGFAVVADEVRALASRTSKSTQEITSMVSMIQEDANGANSAMQQSVEQMDSISQETSALNEILNEVTTKVSEVSAQITQIATAAEEQTTATAEISTNMKNITDGSKNLAVEVDLVNSNINETRAELDKLVEIVRQFEI